MMTNEAQFLLDEWNQLLAQAEMLEVPAQSKGIEHCKEIVDHVPGWDVDKDHKKR